MATDKNKIIVYKDWQKTFNKLTDDEAGRLIKHFFNYVNDENPEPPDRLTEIAFEPIKQTLKRDLKKWEQIADRNRENGSKGGRPKGASNKHMDYFGNEIPEASNGGHFVYLIFDNDRKIFKVGETKNLLQRRLDIKAPSKNLEFYCFGMSDAFTCQEIERQVINDYSDFRISGDWFDISFDQAKAVAKIISQKTQMVSEKPVSVSVRDSVTVSDRIKDTNVSSVDSEKIDWLKLLSIFNEVFGKRCTVVNESVKKSYRARLKSGYTREQIVLAMNNASRDEYHKETNYKHCTLEFFSRANMIDKWANVSNGQKSTIDQSRIFKRSSLNL